MAPFAILGAMLLSRGLAAHTFSLFLRGRPARLLKPITNTAVALCPASVPPPPPLHPQSLETSEL